MREGTPCEGTPARQAASERAARFPPTGGQGRPPRTQCLQDHANPSPSTDLSVKHRPRQQALNSYESCLSSHYGGAGMDQREGLEREADRFDRDRLDYETTVKRFEHITDIRFKLLGLVPTVTGLGALIADANRRTPDVAI